LHRHAPFVKRLPVIRLAWVAGIRAGRQSLRPILVGMATTLQDPKVESLLDRMYAESKTQMSRLRGMHGQLDRPMTTQERTEAMSEFYIPVTPEAGRLLYATTAAAGW
jgi:hypothetical protein